MQIIDEPKSYVDLLHQNFAPWIDHYWMDLWDFIQLTATSHEQFAEISVISGIDVDRVRTAILETKNLADIDAITYSLGFSAGSGGTTTVRRFASEKAVLAHALSERAK